MCLWLCLEKREMWQRRYWLLGRQSNATEFDKLLPYIYVTDSAAKAYTNI